MKEIWLLSFSEYETRIKNGKTIRRVDIDAKMTDFDADKLQKGMARDNIYATFFTPFEEDEKLSVENVLEEALEYVLDDRKITIGVFLIESLLLKKVRKALQEYLASYWQRHTVRVLEKQIGSNCQDYYFDFVFDDTSVCFYLTKAGGKNYDEELRSKLASQAIEQISN